MSPENYPMSAEFDKPREKCGVFGITSRHGQAALEVSVGLNHLQHRGQDAAGITAWNGHSLETRGGSGKVRQIFNEKTIGEFKGGFIGIGHNRYATAGAESNGHNLQPLVRRVGDYEFSLGHNGNLTALAGRLLNYDSPISDTETLADSLQDDIELNGGTIHEALKRVLPGVEGAYTLVLMDKDQLIGVRDPNGFRPLLLGVTDNGEWCFASESGALKKVGVQTQNIQEVKPGQVVVIKDNVRWNDSIKTSVRDETFCINEFVYFSREDQMLKGESVQTRRIRMGYELAEAFPIEADVVMGVPGTAIPIGMGYSAKTGIPYEQGIIKHGDRSFMQPNQLARQAEAETKIIIIPDLIYGRRLIIVDDSIVRGVMTKTLMDMLFDEGAKEAHVLIASPPHKYGCHYGMDTSREDLLIASGKSKDEIRDYIGATSLNYLSLDRLIRAASPESNYFCTACFDGNYPTPVPLQIGRIATSVSH